MNTLCLLLICASAAVGQNLDAPSECEVGELVRLDASGLLADSFVWKTVPETDDFFVVQSGSMALFSGRETGEFLIVVAGATAGEPFLVIHRLAVVEHRDDLAHQITKEINKVTSETKVATMAKLENLFRTMANAPIEPEDMLGTMAKSIQDLLGKDQETWEPLLDVIGDCLDTRSELGSLKTKEDYQRVWLEIANIIKRAVC